MNHLSSLLSVRRRSLSRRVSEGGVGTWLVIACVLIATVGFGWFLAPILSADQVALDAAFWLTAAATSITSFHCMDLLFRVDGVRALDHLPVDLSSLYWDRAVVILFDALAYAVPIAALFAPLGWVHGDPSLLIVSMGMVLLGLPAAGLSSAALYLYVGRRVSGGRLDNPERGADADEADSAPAADADLYGGSGGLLLYAPGIALAGATIALIGVRLGLREIVRPEAPADVLSVVWLIGLATIAVVILYGRSAFAADYIPIRARFREADAMNFDVDLNYQQSVFATSVRGELWASPITRPLVRALALQYQRRHLLVRYVFPVAGVASALTLLRVGADTYPTWVVAVVPAVLLGTVANPWRRLTETEFRPNVLDSLPLDLGDRFAAETIQSAREVGFALFWYGAFVVPATMLGRGLLEGAFVGGASVGTAALVAVAVSLAARINASTVHWLPPIAAAAGGALALYSLVTAAGFGLLALAVVAATAFRYPAPSARNARS